MQENTIKSNIRDIEDNLKHVSVMLETIGKTDKKTTIDMHVQDIQNTVIDIHASLNRVRDILRRPS